MVKYVMALDQGTTSSRCILFDRVGHVCSAAQKEFTQIYPKPGWVEHDPLEIWSSQLSVAVEAMGKIERSLRILRRSVSPTRGKPQSAFPERREGRSTMPFAGSAAELRRRSTG